jgi:hypothetical protein
MSSIVRVFFVVAGAAGLAACGSMGLDLGSGSPRSGVVAPLRLESDPPGAEAKTSVGPGCRTPCAVNVPADREFTVSFTLNGYIPASESVKPVVPDDGRVDIEAPTQPVVELAPNPVYAELQPAPPPAKQRAKARPRAEAPRPQPKQARPAPPDQPAVAQPAQQPAAGSSWPSSGGQASSNRPAPAQSSPAWPAPQQSR